MFINEVCHVVGLTKKSIRFYEENGLLNPKRNTDNDYRIYAKEDIEKLKKIKFLRELNVSIRELIMLEKKKITLESVLLDRIQYINTEEEKFLRVKQMCKKIIDTKASYEDVDITEYSQEMNTLNKEGFTMRDVRSNKIKKIIGAIIPSVLFSLFFIVFAYTISCFQFMGGDKMPWIAYIIIMIVLCALVIGIIINLIARIKEITGGEEDEASKY